MGNGIGHFADALLHGEIGRMGPHFYRSGLLSDVLPIVASLTCTINGIITIVTSVSECSTPAMSSDRQIHTPYLTNNPELFGTVAAERRSLILPSQVTTSFVKATSF